MIKTKVKEGAQVEPEFPLMAQSVSSLGLIVLFVEERHGTVLADPCRASLKGPGYTSHHWNSVLGPRWTILPKGTQVILEQQ